MIFLYSIQIYIYYKLILFVISMNYNFMAMMNPQFENQVGDEIQSTIEEISANERYLLVYFKPEGFQLSQYKQIKPYILVYNNDDQKQINSLIDDFAKQNNFQQSKHRIQWVLYGGFQLKPDMRIKDIKKSLRKDNINGLKVFGWINQQKYYDQECAVTIFIQNELQFNDKAIEVPFYLPTTNDYILYIHITPNKYALQTTEVKKRLSTEIKRVFGEDTKPQNIQIILKTQQQVRVAQFKDLAKFTPSSVLQQKFMIQFKDKLILKQPARQNNSVIVIKGEGVNTTKHYYDDIKDKKVIDVLSNLNPHTNWNQYGLIICDFAIKPFENFSKIDKLCKNSTQMTKHFAAMIIKEEHVFQTEFQKIKIKGEVDFQKIIIPDQENQVHRKSCQDKARDRASKTSHEWFKNNLKNVKPILLYTSSLKVKGSKGQKRTVYMAMNQFLRDQSFCQVQQKDYDKWQLKFAIQLMHQLSKIPKTKEDVLWRGVGYAPKHQIGEQVLFKQFNSSSTSESVAKKFATKALYKITKAKSAHQIKQYSYYQKQDEVLFEPYVTLKIDKISQIKKGQTTTITLFQAHQVEKKPLPENKSLLILWVDDKTKEGKSMWQSLVEIQKTTIMIQLLTTQELQKWMNANKSIVEDQSVQLVLITNMKRIEAGKTVEKAGVHAIEVFKKFKPNSSIFVYIGWIEGAVAKLAQHSLILSDKLKVDNSQKRLREFLKTVGVK